MRNCTAIWTLVALGLATAGSAQNPDQPPAQVEKKTAEPAFKLGAPTPAEKLLDDSIAKIEAMKQYRADVRQVVEMFGYRFIGDGQYAVGPDYRMLFELKVQLTDTTGTLKEVCDGRLHWRSQKILDTQELVKIDLKKLREVLDKPDFNKEIKDQLVQGLGFSGILPLVRGLRDAQKFETFVENKVGEVPVFVLEGQWREEAISKSSFRGQQLSLAKLPQYPYIPDKTTLWIGQQDGWPYRIQLESTKKTQGFSTTMTLEFLNPQLGVELPESLFHFEPPAGVRTDDQTDILYQQLSTILEQMKNAPAKSADSKRTPDAPAKSPEPAAGSGEAPKQEG